MTWARIDDQFFYNKKVAQVDGSAKLLYLAGLVYAANQLTDGLIPERALRFIASTADVANCQDFAKQLLDVGLWDATDEGYMIHDYLDWNPSREQVEETRRVRAQSGKQGGLAKAAHFQQNAKQAPSKEVAKSQQKSTPSPSPSLALSPKDEDDLAPASLEDDDLPEIPPDVRAINNAYDACGLMMTKPHQDAHLLIIKQVGLIAWQQGWAKAMETSKHNIPAYVARCAESAMLAAQRGNGHGKGAAVPTTAEDRKSYYAPDIATPTL
jgi:hypothetical protein